MYLHRNNVRGDADTVIHSLDLDSRENLAMINNDHEQKMRIIENEDYINRMNANAKNRRDDEESRARQQERMTKLKGDIDYNNKKLEGEMARQMEELNIRRLNDQNKHAQQMKIIGNEHEQALKRIGIESNHENHIHEQKMTEINHNFELNLEKCKAQSKKDDYHYQKNLKRIDIERMEVGKRHEKEMAQINNPYKERMAKIKGDFDIKKREIDFQTKKMETEFQKQKYQNDYNLNLLKEKNKEKDIQYNLTMKDKEKEIKEIEGSYNMQQEKLKGEYQQKYLDAETKGKKELEEIKNKNAKEMEEFKQLNQVKLAELKTCNNVKDLFLLNLMKNDKISDEEKIKIFNDYKQPETKPQPQYQPIFYNPQFNQPYMYGQPMYIPGNQPYYNNCCPSSFTPGNPQAPPYGQSFYPPPQYNPNYYNNPQYPQMPPQQSQNDRKEPEYDGKINQSNMSNLDSSSTINYSQAPELNERNRSDY